MDCPFPLKQDSGGIKLRAMTSWWNGFFWTQRNLRAGQKVDGMEEVGLDQSRKKAEREVMKQSKAFKYTGAETVSCLNNPHPFSKFYFSNRTSWVFAEWLSSWRQNLPAFLAALVFMPWLNLADGQRRSDVSLLMMPLRKLIALHFLFLPKHLSVDVAVHFWPCRWGQSLVDEVKKEGTWTLTPPCGMEPPHTSGLPTSVNRLFRREVV